jgi:hypothetical protein
MSSRLIACTALAGLFVAGNGWAESPRKLGPALLVGGIPELPPLKSGPAVGTQNNRSGFFPTYVAGAFTGQQRCPV